MLTISVIIGGRNDPLLRIWGGMEHRDVLSSGFAVIRALRFAVIYCKR
jgi:hypothetical protein